MTDPWTFLPGFKSRDTDGVVDAEELRLLFDSNLEKKLTLKLLKISEFYDFDLINDGFYIFKIIV